MSREAVVLVYHRGKVQEEDLEVVARRFGGKWEGGGVEVDKGIVDIGYVFPTEDRAKSFRRSARRMVGVIETELSLLED